MNTRTDPFGSPLLSEVNMTARNRVILSVLIGCAIAATLVWIWVVYPAQRFRALLAEQDFKEQIESAGLAVTMADCISVEAANVDQHRTPYTVVIMPLGANDLSLRCQDHANVDVRTISADAFPIEVEVGDDGRLTEVDAATSQSSHFTLNNGTTNKTWNRAPQLIKLSVPGTNNVDLAISIGSGNASEWFEFRTLRHSEPALLMGIAARNQGVDVIRRALVAGGASYETALRTSQEAFSWLNTVEHETLILDAIERNRVNADGSIEQCARSLALQWVRVSGIGTASEAVAFTAGTRHVVLVVKPNDETRIAIVFEGGKMVFDGRIRSSMSVDSLVISLFDTLRTK